MRAIIRPGARIEGSVRVPGDKSIAHRWLILAAAARGRSVLRGIPPALDLGSTAGCMAALSGERNQELAAWAANPHLNEEDHRFTWDPKSSEMPDSELIIEGEGWDDFRAPGAALDCGNSGTTMRLLIGALAGREFASELEGDEALSQRPMERVAGPLRTLGAHVTTREGHAPVDIQGAPLHGETVHLDIPSSQVKSAVLLAGLAASGTTTVIEPAATRDHTERLLRALGAPISQPVAPGDPVSVSAFQHDGFEGDLPGDPSSAIFVLAAAILTGGSLEISGVGLNETRTGYFEALGRMGTTLEIQGNGPTSMGEPTGSILTPAPTGVMKPVSIPATEFPLVHDDLLMIAVMSAFASEGEVSRFDGAEELRHKESDRLKGLADGIRGLGGSAEIEGDSLLVRGGGLAGGTADAKKDHRLAMAFTVGALAARSESRIDGIEWADVTFPGFLPTLRFLGAQIDEG